MRYIGVDIIEIVRIKRVIARWKGKFLERVYTERELDSCYKRPSSLAARFAGKEAVIKALGNPKPSIGWKDIEILAEASGKPSVHLFGKAKNQAYSLGLSNLAISLSHSKEYAIAIVIDETK